MVGIFRLRSTLVLALGALLLSVASTMVMAQPGYEVRIGNYSFVPPPNGGNLQERKTRGALGALPNGQCPVLLQFYQLPSLSAREALARRGVHLRDYLGANAYFADVAPGYRPSQRGGRLVRSIMAVAPQWKVSPLLEKGATPKHALAQGGGRACQSDLQRSC